MKYEMRLFQHIDAEAARKIIGLSLVNFFNKLNERES